MDTLLQDVKYATRRLAATPAFTAMAVLTLALGLGANTAIFGALNAVLFRPLPYPEADRLVFVWGHRDTAPTPQLPVSLPVALDIAQRTRSFAQVGTWTSLADTRFSLTGGGPPEDVQYAVVSAGLFPLLGAQQARGRLFGQADDRMGAPHVAIISERLWRTRFGAADDLIGHAITLDGSPYSVVGVLAESFRFVEYPRAPDVWLPLGSDPFRDRRFAPVAAMGVVARLRPGVTLPVARAELGQLAVTIGREFPPLRGWTLVAEPFRAQLTGGRRTLLFALVGAVCLVLLIACANIASLLLIRMSARRREMAVRVALGASPGRLVRLVLVEGLVLAFVAGACGLLVSAWAADVLAVIATGDRNVFVPWRVLARDLRPDGLVFAFAFLLSTISGVLAGLLPALHAGRSRIWSSVNGASQIITRRHRARSLLVAAQVTMSLVLLTGCGLLVRSFSALAMVDPGFTSAHALAVDIALPAAPYARPERVVGFYTSLCERLSAVPGVLAAGASDHLPLGGPPPSTDIRIEGEPAPEPGRELRAEYGIATAGWFAAAGVKVLGGRTFMPSDDAAAARVAVINAAMARALFRGRDPIGVRVALSNEALRFVARDRPPVLDFPSAYRTIVGVVDSVRPELEVEARPAMYVPLSQHPERQMTIVVRAADDAAAVAETVRGMVREIDPAQPIAAVRTLDDVVIAASGESRFRAQMTAVLALIALLLASVGVYGVVAYAVAQRTREIGVRIALGATTSDVVRLSAREGLRPALIGLAAGVPGAAVAALAIRRLLFGVQPFDAITFASALAVLLAVTGVASWLPARRAMRIDPAEALRAE